MKHNKEEKTIGEYDVVIYSEMNAECLLIQPVDGHDMEEMQAEIEHIEDSSACPFTLVAVRIGKWNAELTPWPAPPVFGKIPFGDGAMQTLDFIIHQVISQQTSSLVGKVFLGGYSLAGLFALWASYQYRFDGVAAASPSVWYKDWLGYSETGTPLVPAIYLSLGDKEHHSKNSLMATVDECMRRQKEIIDRKGIRCTLEWNEGNHFTDNGIRTAKGFLWLMDNR
jgi:predicted alpha/beta superfamily hydrolase